MSVALFLFLYLLCGMRFHPTIWGTIFNIDAKPKPYSLSKVTHKKIWFIESSSKSQRGQQTSHCKWWALMLVKVGRASYHTLHTKTKILKVMRRMNFSDHFISLVMKCYSLVSYKLLLNGQISKHSQMTRGLRQGDPLSPYMFILCMNVLSCLLTDAENAKHIEGI